MISSSGRTGFRNRTVNSAQNANRPVGTAHAQTMISSSTVVKMPPWTTPRKPMCAGATGNALHDAPVGRKTQFESDGVAFAADEAMMGVRQFTHDNNWQGNGGAAQVNFPLRKKGGERFSFSRGRRPG